MTVNSVIKPSAGPTRPLSEHAGFNSSSPRESETRGWRQPERRD
jgi:hypothetical protein